MFLTWDLVREYQRAYSRKYREELPDKCAERDLANLAELIRLVINKGAEK